MVREEAPRGWRLVAIDAGAAPCVAAGRVPDVLVGDMDSVAPHVLRELEAKGTRIVRHPARKRDTDAALALLETDDDVLLLGPGGGRADHAFANLHLMHQLSRRARVRAVDVDARTWVVTPRAPLRVDLPAGATVSVLPLFERCEGVTYLGLEYPLVDAVMDVGDPYGVSNVALPPPQEVRLTKGVLLVIAPRMQA